MKIVFLSFLLFLVQDSFTKNTCFQRGTTWSSLGELEVLGPVLSLSGCLSLCNENESCHGYTWIKQSQGKVGNLCILFESLQDPYECKDCISGSFSGDIQDCLCDETEGECILTNQNFLGGKYGHSSIECFVECLILDSCNFYTFFGIESENVKNQCLFFTTCDEISVSSGSITGKVNCEGTSTTESTTTMQSSTTANDLCESIPYE